MANKSCSNKNITSYYSHNFIREEIYMLQSVIQMSYCGHKKECSSPCREKKIKNHKHESIFICVEF